MARPCEGRNESMGPGATRPFFLFLNLMDVHGPYFPSSSATGKFWTGPIPPLNQSTPECGWVALRETGPRHSRKATRAPAGAGRGLSTSRRSLR